MNITNNTTCLQIRADKTIIYIYIQTFMLDVINWEWLIWQHYFKYLFASYLQICIRMTELSNLIRFKWPWNWVAIKSYWIQNIALHNVILIVLALRKMYISLQLNCIWFLCINMHWFKTKMSYMQSCVSCLMFYHSSWLYNPRVLRWNWWTSGMMT